MAVIGDARVSTAGKNLDPKLAALSAAGAARTFADNGDVTVSIWNALSSSMLRSGWRTTPHSLCGSWTVWALNTSYVLDVLLAPGQGELVSDP